MSLHLPHFKCFLFPHCVSLSLGSSPSQLIVHHLTTAFLHIIYCVHWFHLNSVVRINDGFHFSWHTGLPSLCLEQRSCNVGYAGHWFLQHGWHYANQVITTILQTLTLDRTIQLISPVCVELLPLFLTAEQDTERWCSWSSQVWCCNPK